MLKRKNGPFHGFLVRIGLSAYTLHAIPCFVWFAGSNCFFLIKLQNSSLNKVELKHPNTPLHGPTLNTTPVDSAHLLFCPTIKPLKIN